MIQIVFKQTLTMFMYMLAGFVLYKLGLVDKQGSKSLGNLLIYFIFPVVVIRSFLREFSTEVLKSFGIGFMLCVIGILLSVFVCRFIFRKRPMENFAAAFPNSGFFGVPLVTAVLGQEYVIYSIGTSFMVGSLQHTYGVSLLTGEREKFSFKAFLLSPNCVATIIGLLLFLTGTGTKLPPIVNSFIDGISAMNAPVVMIILGSYLAQSDLIKMISNPMIYFISMVRLIIVPVIMVLVFSLVPISPKIKLSLLMPFATACGANVAVYSQLNNKDYPYACQIVAMSTILSIVTIPLIVLFGQKLFGV